MLQVCEAGHHHIHILLGDKDYRLLEPYDFTRDEVDLMPQIKPEVQSNLIIPTSGRVQFSTDGPDPANEFALDRKMNIFFLRQTLAARQIPKNHFETLDDALGFASRDDPAFGEHARMRNRAL